MARTRATKGAPAPTTADNAPVSKAKFELPPEADNPPQVFVLPKKATAGSRIVTLPNPRYAKPTRYLACPQTGLYEFTKIAVPKTTPRSWLIETRDETQSAPDSERSKAQVTKGADLFVATQIDPLFLVLPALAASSAAKDKKRLFLSSEDHFDALPESSSHLSEILQWDSVRRLFEARMAAACDTVDAGDERMFRLNEKKLALELVSKARKMSKTGLPPSMEEKFVKKPLEAPIQIRQSKTVVETTAITETTAINSEVSTPRTETTDSQTSSTGADSLAVSFVSEASTAATSVAEEVTEVVSAMQASDEVVALQRLRVAFNFICSSYVAPALAEQLQAQLKDAQVSSVDFRPLDDYLGQLAKLRSEAAASRSVDDYSRKRVLDDEQEEIRAEKKRKLEEEKKRKANESRGVRDLKKVNTSGMMKLSAFFAKKK